MTVENPINRSRWASIIKAVRTPLGFLTLVVLVIQGILVLLVPQVRGRDFSLLLGSMVLLLFVLVAGIIYIVMRRPELLMSPDAVAARERGASADKLRKALAEAQALRQAVQAADAAAATAQQEAKQCRAANAALTDQAAKLDSLRNRIWALLHHSDAVSLSFILGELGANDESTRNQVLGLIGTLIDEGRVQTAFTGYYKAVRK